MAWNFHGKDISELMGSTLRQHLDLMNPDAILNIETHLFDVTLTADSSEYDLDVGKNLWLNKGRWSRLIKEYVPLDALQRFVDQALEILARSARPGATANMMFHDPKRYAKKHRWGGCLMGATFRGDNHRAGRATLTFYSRTTYIGYMGFMDAALASVMAQEIVHQYNTRDTFKKFNPISLADISFRWHISSMQLHCFKTLPYIYSQPDLEQRLQRYARQRRAIDSLPPTWKHLTKWYIKVVDGWQQSLKMSKTPRAAAEKMLHEEKYGPFRRIKRRWLEHTGQLSKNVPPSLTLEHLDFSKAIIVEASGSDDEEDDDCE